MAYADREMRANAVTKNSASPIHSGTVALSEICLLLLVAAIPFAALPLMNFAPLLSGLTLPVLLGLIMMGGFALDRRSYKFVDPLERGAILAFLVFAGFSAICFLRSIPHLATFNAVFPKFFSTDVASYVKNSLIGPFLYASTFLFVVKNMSRPAAMTRLFDAVVLAMGLLSIILLAMAILNPQYLLTTNRVGMVVLCENAVNMHYTDVGTMFELSCPALVYMSIKRGGWYQIVYLLALIAVIIVQARTALYIFILVSVLALLATGRAGTLFKWAPVIGVAAFIFLGSLLFRLLFKGFAAHSEFSLAQFLSGRNTLIWLPLAVEWLSNPSRLFWGVGLHGMLISSFLQRGMTLQVAEAHNAFLEFFLDNGIIMTGMLLCLLFAWFIWAVRLGRKLHSGLYWVMLLGPIGFLISCITGRHFYPNVENMMLFPMLGAYVNAARLALYSNAPSKAAAPTKGRGGARPSA
ncbi:MAG: hypothetical protein JSR60_13860 [Proteobacteria bacterium]|nr:hypothetical protein [Pseudomonadota bacterium]